MKNRYELSLFSFYDHTGMVKHFERMALRGWLLCGLGGLWKYQKTQPRPLKFAVSYSPEVNGFEPEVPQGQADLEALCAAAGWQLAGRSGQLQVFYNEDPEAVPLDTDPDIQIDVIHRTMKKNFLPAYSMLAVVAVMQIVTQLGQLERGSGFPLYGGAVYYFSGASWLTLFTWSALLVIYLVELGQYLGWLRRARRRAEEGLMTPSPNSRPIQGLAVAFLTLTVLSWMLSSSLREMVFILLGILLVVFLAMAVFSKLLKAMKVSAKVNRALTVVVTLVLTFGFVGLAIRSELLGSREDYAGKYEYMGTYFYYHADDIPLRLHDLGYGADDEDSTRMEEQYSPLVRRLVCRQMPRMNALERPELNYVIADIRFAPLWELCLQDFLRGAAQTVDAAPWGAHQAWQLEDGADTVYVLCWDDRMVYLELEEDLTDAQKAVAGEKLKP